jgi:MFS superfamily sulfate permease-like transporter
VRRAAHPGQHAVAQFFGIHGAHGNFGQSTSYFLQHLHETNATSLTIGRAALAVLVLGKIFLKNKPVALFVVVGGIVTSGLLRLDASGLKLLGEVLQGLPAIGLPAIHWADVNELLPLKRSPKKPQDL